MKNFRHKIPIQIRFKDLDDMGHVNNANHLSYIELARVKYFQEVFDILDRTMDDFIKHLEENHLTQIRA